MGWKNSKAGFRSTRDGFDEVKTNVLVRELCRLHLSVSKYLGQLSEGEVSAEWKSRLYRGSKVTSVGEEGTSDSNFLRAKRIQPKMKMKMKMGLSTRV